MSEIQVSRSTTPEQILTHLAPLFAHFATIHTTKDALEVYEETLPILQAMRHSSYPFPRLMTIATDQSLQTEAPLHPDLRRLLVTPMNEAGQFATITATAPDQVVWRIQDVEVIGQPIRVRSDVMPQYRRSARILTTGSVTTVDPDPLLLFGPGQPRDILGDMACAFWPLASGTVPIGRDYQRLADKLATYIGTWVEAESNRLAKLTRIDKSLAELFYSWAGLTFTSNAAKAPLALEMR